MTSRELVYKTLEFRNYENRVPRDLWTLPWAANNFPEELRKIQRDFPGDFMTPDPCYKEKDISRGDGYKVGKSIDGWGCLFENKNDGYIGEVKEALLPVVDEETDWDDTSLVHFPVEWFSIDSNQINAQCRATDKFVQSGACPRPFEQLQFIRTTEQFYIDLIQMTPGLQGFISRMHTFYCDLLEIWAKTEVDCLNIMDDWGAQQTLLIDPALWRRVFKPMYKDYADIAHRAGKKIFMHSDGHILSIYPDLIELGIDALNSQVFCMGVENLRQYAGKITFWGEIDRQHILPHATVLEVKTAVHTVREALWQSGGAIAQCEFGVGSNPANVYAVYEAWLQGAVNSTLRK